MSIDNKFSKYLSESTSTIEFRITVDINKKAEDDVVSSIEDSIKKMIRGLKGIKAFKVEKEIKK